MRQCVRRVFAACGMRCALGVLWTAAACMPGGRCVCLTHRSMADIASNCQHWSCDGVVVVVVRSRVCAKATRRSSSAAADREVDTGLAGMCA
jgi:hypothetical protein